MRTLTEPGLVPFITMREGEESAPDNLLILPSGGHERLRYADEDPRDRDLRGVLWARCSFNPVDERNMPTGKPRWKDMHPYRQMVTMQAMRCQVCAERARTPLGFIFLAGPKDLNPEKTTVLTNQPPVCARHVRAAAKLCPHLEEVPTVFLAQSAPLHGVTGVLYGIGDQGVQVVARPEAPMPYGNSKLRTFLASQLVRRLGSFRVLDMEELLQALRAAAA
ncbi:hypothetical protein [Streptomyces sp. NPDC003697]